MMKLTYLKMFKLAFIAILFNTNLYSQNADLTIGIIGGVDYFNYPIEVGSAESVTEYDLGYFIGFYGTINLTDKFALRPELIYRRHRADEKIGDIVTQTPSGVSVIFITPTEIEVSDAIIQLPIKIQYKVIDNLEFGLGPQFMYIIKREFHTTENTFESDSAFFDNSKIVTDIDYDRFDFGLSLGINYRINSKFGIIFNYTAGLIKRDDKINTSIFDLGIDFKFN
ncbi:MAG: hypothetical protein CVU07_00865 [Bacteroidetes bacterium HGW-Bacteroidetes-23]|nr:MAG: hypothetical protein CVU07_00865 [Bacteroidetes bacterium HGW-Bacteroidetes-23]